MVKKQKVIPRLKPVPYTLADLSSTLRQPQLVPSTSVTNNLSDTATPLYITPDLPNNKRGFKYIPCRPNPYLESIMYSTTDIPPYSSRWSYFDRSPEMSVSKDMSIVGTQEYDGWRSSRAVYSVREGAWYIEYKIINGIESDGRDIADPNDDKTPGTGNGSVGAEETRSVSPGFYNPSLAPHVRMGIARPEASLEAPVGFDGYGYGIRDINCEKIHLSKRGEIRNNKEEALSESIDLKVGDVVGLLLELPSMKVQREIAAAMIQENTLSDPENIAGIDPNNPRIQDSFVEKGVEREMIPIKYKNEKYFEEYEYTGSKAMEHVLNPVTVFGEHAIPDKERFQPAKLPGSSISLYVNGKYRGRPFENLSAFLPPASEQRMSRNMKTSKKAVDDSQLVIDRDDGSLGYYPMVSCFRGGAVQINTSTNLWITPDDLAAKLQAGEVKPYGARLKAKIVEDYVLDLLDDSINKYLDKKEREL